MPSWSVWVFLAALAAYAVFLFNRLVALRQTRKNAFADIDVQLKLRHDLIPNLVATVKRYVQHEKTVFENVTNARASAMGARTIDEKGAAELSLGQSLMKLLAVAENYPELKADDTFNRFQSELAGIEKSIAAARRFFNNATAEFNTAMQQFLTNLVASMFGFQQEHFFAIDEDERRTFEAPVKVSF